MITIKGHRFELKTPTGSGYPDLWQCSLCGRLRQPLPHPKEETQCSGSESQKPEGT